MTDVSNGEAHRAAIVEAWIAIEQAATAAMKRNDAEVESGQLHSPVALVEFLGEPSVVASRCAGLMDELMHLRNTAAHAKKPRADIERTF